VFLVAGATWVIAGLVAWGALFEGKRWGIPIECARYVLGVVLVAGVFSRGWVAVLVALALAFASTVLLVLASRSLARPLGPA